MSVKLMSAIFDTEFRDLPLPPSDNAEGQKMAKASSMKIVLLALADHANDEGESSYPGFTKLELKTGLSRQGISNVLSALKYNGLIFVSDEPSKLGTNNYTLNLKCYPKLLGIEDERLLVKSLDQSSYLTSTSQATLPELVKPLDLKHTLTTNETPLPKGDLMDALLQNEVIAQQQKDACIAFESALGFGSLPWSKTDWQKLARWLSETYQKDPSAFTDYAKWRMGDGKYQAMSNNKIRQDPRAFLDTGWPTFLAHSAMQEFRNTSKGKEYQKVVIEQEAIAQNPRRKG